MKLLRQELRQSSQKCRYDEAVQNRLLFPILLLARIYIVCFSLTLLRKEFDPSALEFDSLGGYGY